MSEEQINDLAELYWKSADYRKTTKNLVKEAFIKGFLMAKERYG